MLCQAFAVGSAAFVGRRGVERRATVRISVVGVPALDAVLSLIGGRFRVGLCTKVIL
jgi:hypothetical protein